MGPRYAVAVTGSPLRLRPLVPIALCALAVCMIAYAQADQPPPPQAPEVQLICGCEDASLFTAARTPLRPDFDFDAWELSTTAGAKVKGSSLRWHFIPRAPSQLTARLGYSRQVPGPLGALSLWVKNPNAHDIGLRLELTDADGIRYLSPTVALADELGWRQLVFPVAEMRADAGQQDPRPGVDCPVIWLQVVAVGLAPGKPHTIYLDEFEARHAPTSHVEARELTAPRSVGPGERIAASATLVFASQPPPGARVLAQLRQGTSPVAEAALQVDAAPVVPGAPCRAQAGDLRVPVWLRPGRYELALVSPDFELSGPGTEPLPIAVAGTVREDEAVKLDLSASPPAINAGGRRLPALVGQVYGADQAAPRSLAAAGLSTIALPATTDIHPFGWAPDVADGPDGLDFSGLDRNAAAMLSASPDALLMLQVYLDSSAAWDEQHPDQLVTFGSETVAPPTMWGRKRTFADLASAAWARGAQQRLKSLVEHVEGAPYGHRVIGYELLAGDVGGWRPWGSGLDLGDETGQLRQAAYRTWLIDKYRNLGILRDAWGLAPMPPGGVASDAVPGPQTWEQITIPREGQAPWELVMYDPKGHGPFIDLSGFRAELPARLIERMAETVREASAGRKLVGASYGHMLNQSGGPWRWPHLALGELLSCQDLDLLTGPLLHVAPQVRPDFPVAAARAAGKLYLDRLPAAWDAPQAGAGAFVEAGRAGAVALVAPGGGTEQVALIVDDLSARYISRTGGLAGPLLASQIEQLNATGMPWRLHTLAELLAGGVPPAKVYIFPDAFDVSIDQRRTLVETLCRDRRTLLWVYAPAAVDKYMLSGRTMKNLTGIALSLLTTPGPLQVEVSPQSPMLDEHVAQGLTWGMARCRPRFFAADDKADRLGQLVGTEFGGLAVREYSNCISFYSAAPAVPAEVLRGVFRRAGLGQ